MFGIVVLQDEEGSNIKEVSSFPNIGPIVDMCLADSSSTSNNSGGQHRQLVTCSGAYGDGSLRIIRSGIGVHEQVFYSRFLYCLH